MHKILLLCCCCLPLRHLQLNSRFGYRVHPLTGRYSFHAGIDLRARHDTVFSVLPGSVLKAGFDERSGVFITVRHGPFQSAYGHLSQVFVSERDSLSCGQPIGITGSTGRVTGEHLHFSVRFNGRPIDPLLFLRQLILNQIP